MALHPALVVPIKLKEHPDADSLSIVEVRGFNIVVRTDDWENIPLGVYIEPDSIVRSDNPIFEFVARCKKCKNPKNKHPLEECEEAVIDEKVRITVRRFRGIYSQGLLIPAPIGSTEGDDLSELLGVERYEPPISCIMGGAVLQPPDGGFRPVYDIESYNNYRTILNESDFVRITEKIHGTNARYTTDQLGNLFCGTRTQWRKEDPDKPNTWWTALRHTHGLINLIKENHVTVYGEVYGGVQKGFSYDSDSNNSSLFRAFDIWCNDNSTWLNVDEFDTLINKYKVPVVPILFDGFFNEDAAKKLAEGKTTLGSKHVTEGVVIKPHINRYDPKLGRVILKIVGNGYYEKQGRIK